MGSVSAITRTSATLVLAVLCFDARRVGGFTPSTLRGPHTNAYPTAPCARWRQRVPPCPSRRCFRRIATSTVILGAAEASNGGEHNPVESYKRQMEEFMAAAHEKRLQAMEAVKAEVERGYEQQIQELQAQLASLPAPAPSAAPVRTAEPALVGAATGGSSHAVGSATANLHPAYAARAERPGWEARWGTEEVERVSGGGSTPTVSTTESAASADAGVTTHPAYAARQGRPGWDTRWGSEESARVSGLPTSGNEGNVNPAYAARHDRPGWDARWGAEEIARVSGLSTTVTAGVESTDAAKDVHPAYAARHDRPGWDARWGAEEIARVSGLATTTAATGVESPDAAKDVHPAYAARHDRPGWDARWGAEESSRVSGLATTTAATGVESTGAATDVHPAYAVRHNRPGWDARWGVEESARVSGLLAKAAPAAATTAVSNTPAARDAHPAYTARTGRPGWDSRWGAEEVARVSGVSIAAATTVTVEESAVPVPSDAHPAYVARNQRAGWEARWGSEEPERVAGAVAGEIAVAGAAECFSTAGGLEDAPASATPPESPVRAADAAVQPISDDPLVDEFLPRDVEELQELVISSRRQFQDYMIRSLEANNQVKADRASLDVELSSLKATLAAKEELLTSVQESYLEYMSRSAGRVAEAKNTESELAAKISRLVVEAEELQRFTQEYMVKAAQEKQNAVEAAAASSRAQAADHIKALQEQVLRLQAGG